MGLIGLIGLTGLIGCAADTECRQTMGIHLNVVFLCDSLRQSTDSARLSKDSLAMDTIRFSTITGMEIRGVGRDSILYTADQVFSKAKLPLRPDSLHSDFVLTYNGWSDTLTIHHENNMQFISLACGCLVYHTIESLSDRHILIDSTEILNTLVTTASDDHIRLYFHKW